MGPGIFKKAKLITITVAIVCMTWSSIPLIIAWAVEKVLALNPYIRIPCPGSQVRAHWSRSVLVLVHLLRIHGDIQ